LVTDNWPSYRDLPGVRHNPITLGPMAAHVALPWIHRRFANLKRWGLGEFSGVTVQGKDMLLTGFRREAIHYNLSKKTFRKTVRDDAFSSNGIMIKATYELVYLIRRNFARDNLVYGFSN
jgi:hypothetical protein